MQVKCDYCGSWMEDSEEFCPNCGAANANLKRVADKTPQTIEELENWYKARNLPPYETTRFFIGIDYKLPKAFGIFKDGDEYVVYKNKADGSRAVRYRGTDEAYAVNEIYLRLKEEILNQKNVNAAKRSSGETTQKAANKKKPGCGLITVIILAVMSIVTGIFTYVDYVEESRRPQLYEYYLNGNDVYYYLGYVYDSGYEWWQFDEASQDWHLDLNSDNREAYTDSLSKDNYCGNFSDLMAAMGLENCDESTSVYNISNSKTYIDAHHSNPYQNAYYEVDGQAYYYLNDLYGSSYGSGDNSGWYTYEEDTGWTYYSSGDSKEELGEELWYNDDKYYLGTTYSDYTSGSVYDFSGTEAAEWSSAQMATQFESTTWYDEYTESKTAYDEEYKNTYSSSSDSDSDSDWNWSSSDSWDSGSTDWDSDW